MMTEAASASAKRAAEKIDNHNYKATTSPTTMQIELK